MSIESFFSQRLTEFTEAYRVRHDWSVRKLCELSGLGPDKHSTLRRLLNFDTTWDSDTAFAVAQAISAHERTPWQDLWTWLGERPLPIAGPFTEILLGRFQQADPRHVAAIWHPELLYGREAPGSITVGCLPAFLIPDGSLAKSVWAHARQIGATRRATQAEVTLSKKQRDLYLNRAHDGPCRRIVLHARSYLRVARQSALLSCLTPTERQELDESLHYDGTDRRLLLGILEDNQLATTTRDHLRRADIITAIDDRLVIKRPAQSFARILYERSAESQTNERLDHELGLLVECLHHTPLGLSTPAVFDELRRYLL